MPETVWINGRYLDRADAKVSAFDAGFQHAVGLFETMLATEGRVFRLERHLSRLARSAADLGLSDSIKTKPLAEIVEDVVRRSELAEDDDRARIRLTLTAGDLNMLRMGSPASGGGTPGGTPPLDPTLMVVVTPATDYPEEMFTRGVGVMVPSARATRHDPGAGHKTINYWWRLQALRQAAAVGMGECLLLTDTNHLCGGAVSNVFLVKDGVLSTPTARDEEPEGASNSPVLPGVTRGAIMELAVEAGLRVERRVLDINHVLGADEVFLTNSGWGVLPVVRVEGHVVGKGEPGPITAKARALWLRAIRDEA
jgi:branched-subunit amino acid aminotransferase/4-amino-4-deoxychorismate lyase